MARNQGIYTARHHGASGITFSSATWVIFSTQKVSQKYGTFLRKSKIKIMGVAKPLFNLYFSLWSFYSVTKLKNYYVLILHKFK
jgi:hypothetical protein